MRMSSCRHLKLCLQNTPICVECVKLFANLFSEIVLPQKIVFKKVQHNRHKPKSKSLILLVHISKPLIAGNRCSRLPTVSG